MILKIFLFFECFVPGDSYKKETVYLKFVNLNILIKCY